MTDIVTVVVAVVVIVVGVLGGLLMYAKNYVRIPPNKAMVVFGRKMPGDRKYTILLHGGKFIVPIYEDYGFLPLEVFTDTLELKDLWTKDKVRVEAKLVIQYALLTEGRGLEDAAQNFFKKDDEVIKRAVEAKVTAAGLDIMREHDGDHINAERTKVSEEWKAKANKELKALGLEVRTIVLHHDMKIRRGATPAEGDLPAMKAHLKDLRTELADLEGKLSAIEEDK